MTVGYTVTGAPLTVASTLASITTLINSNFAGNPYNVTATVIANTYVQVITDDPSSPAFELSSTTSSTSASATAITINSVSSTLQVPSTPTTPSMLEQYQRSVIDVRTANMTNTSMVPAGEVYKITINGRCYDYITQTGGTTAAQIRNSFISQINGATHKFRKFQNGSTFGVTASTYGGAGLYVTADYLGYSDYGTEFIIDKDVQDVPGDANSNGYEIVHWLDRAVSQYICGPDIINRTGALPNCEITATTPSTQFFAESENYQYITWSLSSVNPGTGSPLTVGDNISATTFTQRGIIDWTTGFHGSFNLNATAMGCDGVTTSPVSTRSIVIQSKAVTPTAVSYTHLTLPTKRIV